MVHTCILLDIEELTHLQETFLQENTYTQLYIIHNFTLLLSCSYFLLLLNSANIIIIILTPHVLSNRTFQSNDNLLSTSPKHQSWLRVMSWICQDHVLPNLWIVYVIACHPSEQSHRCCCLQLLRYYQDHETPPCRDTCSQWIFYSILRNSCNRYANIYLIQCFDNIPWFCIGLTPLMMVLDANLHDLFCRYSFDCEEDCSTFILHLLGNNISNARNCNNGLNH